MEAAIPRTWNPGIIVATSKTLQALPPAEASAFGKSLDEMGVRSAKAQGLSKPITSNCQMRTTDNKLYLAVSRGVLRGMLRVGKRQLFVRKQANGEYVQICPVCVLDFYVHESCQRSGEGSQLFHRMLQNENLAPHMMGYDRPSPKLVSFMRKHFGLKSYMPQSNHFVIFDEYWKGVKSRSTSAPPSATHLLKCREQAKSSQATNASAAKVVSGAHAVPNQQPSNKSDCAAGRPNHQASNKLDCAAGRLGVDGAEIPPDCSCSSGKRNTSQVASGAAEPPITCAARAAPWLPVLANSMQENTGFNQQVNAVTANEKLLLPPVGCAPSSHTATPPAGQYLTGPLARAPHIATTGSALDARNKYRREQTARVLMRPF